MSTIIKNPQLRKRPGPCPISGVRAKIIIIYMRYYEFHKNYNLKGKTFLNKVRTKLCLSKDLHNNNATINFFVQKNHLSNSIFQMFYFN